MALDYKWSLRNLQWDTEEYNSTIAKVWSMGRGRGLEVDPAHFSRFI